MSAVKLSFRKAAFGSAFALAALSASFPGNAQASDISQRDCANITETALRVVKTLGPQTLSTEFKRSLHAFLITDNKNECSGSRDILTPNVNDVAAFNTIRTFLLAGSRPISLQKLGLRSVDPATLASARPEPEKRSEVGAPSPRG